MAQRTSKMKCPQCGAEMNHHADKLVTWRDADDGSRIDPAFGGLIQETHGCPRCGNVEFRQAEARD